MPVHDEQQHDAHAGRMGFLPLSVCARKSRSSIICISVHSCLSSCRIFSLTRSFFNLSSNSSLLTMVFNMLFSSWGVAFKSISNVTIPQNRASGGPNCCSIATVAWEETSKVALISLHHISLLNISYVTSCYISYSNITDKWQAVTTREAVSVTGFRFRRWHHRPRLTFFWQRNMFLFM